MTITIGTSGGNKQVPSVYVGTAGGNKVVQAGYVGTASGNKQFFSNATYDFSVTKANGNVTVGVGSSLGNTFSMLVTGNNFPGGYSGHYLIQGGNQDGQEGNGTAVTPGVSSSVPATITVYVYFTAYDAQGVNRGTQFNSWTVTFV